MKRFLIIDAANMFFKSRHVASRQSDSWDKVGFALHCTITSVNKAWRDHKADHVVWCLEGKSWRKSFYQPYKQNRAIARAALTEKEAEEEQLFWDAFENLKTYLVEKTNCTVLQHPELEADDLIAGFIQSHSEDEHVIISSDSDFHQLLSETVSQYNGITDELHTIHGIYDKKGNPVIDKKTKSPKVIPDPKWILFEKCMRGDTSDNIFSAYPGVRTKSSKNKIGLTEAFEDRDKKGFAWNNLMLQSWVDHNGVEHKVIDDYNRNVTLIDLTAQPDDIKKKIQDTIITHSVKKGKPMVGAQFLKFCGKYDLSRLSENSTQCAEFLGAEYPV